MSHHIGRFRWPLVVVLGLLVAVAGWHYWGRAESNGTPAPAAAAPAEPVQALPPAAHLRIPVGENTAREEALLATDSGAWDQKPTNVLLSRTPRIYQTEPPVDRTAPACEVRALHSGSKLYLRLMWDDVTRNAPEAPPAMTGEAGDPKQLYKRPTRETSTFPDAAAVMVPERWTGPAFPSLLMGDVHSPARLYYWNASRGAAVLSASGRATPQPTGESFPHHARHADGKWALTVALPEPPNDYPVAFAIWDGAYGDRDGLKFFSVWYVLSRVGR
jgi:hypothetical protein